MDENGEFILGLEYDPDLGGVEPFRIMQLCEGTPTIDSGVVTDADIPLGETWCIAATLSTVVDGEMQPTYLVYGQEDPGIRFR